MAAATVPLVSLALGGLPAAAVAQAASTRRNDRPTAAPARLVNTSRAHLALAGFVYPLAVVVFLSPAPVAGQVTGRLIVILRLLTFSWLASFVDGAGPVQPERLNPVSDLLIAVL